MSILLPLKWVVSKILNRIIPMNRIKWPLTQKLMKINFWCIRHKLDLEYQGYKEKDEK